jgi:hypothetical protein
MKVLFFAASLLLTSSCLALEKLHLSFSNNKNNPLEQTFQCSRDKDFIYSYEDLLFNITIVSETKKTATVNVKIYSHDKSNHGTYKLISSPLLTTALDQTALITIGKNTQGVIDYTLSILPSNKK